jgi:hypothetical protein
MINAVYSNHAGKITKFNYMYVNFSKNIRILPKKSHAHLQCVHNNCARFEECQLKGVGGVDYTK